MSDNVYLKSGEQPRVFSWGNNSDGTKKVTTSTTGSSDVIPQESPNATFQCISAAASTCIIEGTNEAASSTGVNNNWVTIGTITQAGAGSAGIVSSNTPWRWVRARLTVATTATSVIMGI